MPIVDRKPILPPIGKVNLNMPGDQSSPQSKKVLSVHESLLENNLLDNGAKLRSVSEIQNRENTENETDLDNSKEVVDITKADDGLSGLGKDKNEVADESVLDKDDEIPLDGKSTDLSESVLSDNENDRDEILAALQSITNSTDHNFNDSANGTVISDLFGPDDGDESHEDIATPPAELGLATKTLTELNFTWDSTIATSALGTLNTHCSAPDNQYFQGTGSEFDIDNKMEDSRIEDRVYPIPVTGVTFDNKLNVYTEPLKLGRNVEIVEDTFSDIDTNFARQSELGEDSEYSLDNRSSPSLISPGCVGPGGFAASGPPSPRNVQRLIFRNASRLALESREAMFRRAMSLLSARCTSVKQDQTEGGLPFGIQSPKYFYVTQDKPLPMEPLKAWRGYNGNVYFEPIQINHLKVDEAEVLRAKTSIPRTRQKLTAKLASQQQQRLAITDKENKADSRSESRQTNKSTQSNTSTGRQMAILDRQMVANRLNDNINEDMIWIEGQENTGSLAIRPRSHPDRKARDRDLQYNKERIKKGSVVHKLYEERKAKQRPKLTVSGGKFTPPTSMSPLLRTQTQYSLSHRLTTNSPDPYHGDAKLPPLDHLRASLKHMNVKSSPVAKGYNRSVTLTDDMKPFIKYSPEVVAKFSQQAAL